MARSANDWAALKKAEEAGRERPGTYERLWREYQETRALEEKNKIEADFAEAIRLHKEAIGSDNGN